MGLKEIHSMADELAKVQTEVTRLNSQLDELKSKKEEISNKIVEEMKLLGSDQETTGLVLDGIGILKLDTQPYPRINDIGKFLAWGAENKLMLPALTVNPKTLSAWYKEEQKINQPLPPEEVMPVFWKTTAKVVKRA